MQFFQRCQSCLYQSQVLAKPWLDAGDMKLRHELQLLSDAGLLNAPLTTWPLASKDIEANLKQPVNGFTNFTRIGGRIRQR